MFIENNTQLLSGIAINEYNYDECRDNVKKILAKYEVAQYKYRNIMPPKITADYEIRYSSYTPRKNDKVANFVLLKLETEEEIIEFYNILTNIFLTFTKDEKVYFVESLLKRRSEDFICEMINISKNTLAIIKKSCIIKLALAFGKEVYN